MCVFMYMCICISLYIDIYIWYVKRRFWEGGGGVAYIYILCTYILVCYLFTYVCGVDHGKG